MVGELVGGAIQVAVGERVLAADHGDRVGLFGGSFGDLAVEGSRRGGDALGPGPLPHHPLPLTLGEEGERGDRPGRVGHGGGEEVVQVVAEARDGLLLEELGAVLDQRPEPARMLLELDGQVEQRGVPLQRVVGDVEITEARAGPRGVLQHHHRLDERRAAGVALRLDRLHQALERHVLVGERVEHRPPDLPEQGVEGRLRIDPGAQHDGVDQEADQPFQAALVPSGGGRADGDVLLAGVAGEEGLDRRRQRHEERGVLGPGPLLEAVHGGGRHLEADDGSPRGAHGRPRPVGGEFERRDALQLLAPPVEPAAEQTTVLQAAALPGGEVRILHGDLGKAVRTALDPGRVQLAQLLGDDAHRPAVGDDVVHAEEAHVLGPAEADDQDADERAVPQVVGALQLALGEDPCLLLVRRLLHAPLGRQHGVDRLDALPVDHVEGGPQRLVARHQVTARGAERVGVEAAGQPQPDRRVVLGAALVEVLQEPEPLLAEGHGQEPAPRGPGHGGRLALPRLVGVGGVDGDGELGDGRVREEEPGRETGAELAPDV